MQKNLGQLLRCFRKNVLKSVSRKMVRKLWTIEPRKNLGICYKNTQEVLKIRLKSALSHMLSEVNNFIINTGPVANFPLFRWSCSVVGESTLLPSNTTFSPSCCSWGEVGTTWGHMYLRPKDSNTTVGVHDHATQKAPEAYDRQTDKLSSHYTLCLKKKHVTTFFAITWTMNVGL